VFASAGPVPTSHHSRAPGGRVKKNRSATSGGAFADLARLEFVETGPFQVASVSPTINSFLPWRGSHTSDRDP